MEILALDQSGVIPDGLPIRGRDQKYQQILRVGIDQVLQRDLKIQHVSVALIIGDVRTLHQTASIQTPHFKGKRRYFRLVGIYRHRNGTVAFHRKQTVSQIRRVHGRGISVKPVDVIAFHVHRNNRIRRFAHLHRHIRISLIHDLAQHKQGNGKNRRYNNAFNYCSPHK